LICLGDFCLFVPSVLENNLILSKGFSVHMLSLLFSIFQGKRGGCQFSRLVLHLKCKKTTFNFFNF
jgi:hypothetical protein